MNRPLPCAALVLLFAAASAAANPRTSPPAPDPLRPLPGSLPAPAALWEQAQTPAPVPAWLVRLLADAAAGEGPHRPGPERLADPAAGGAAGVPLDSTRGRWGALMGVGRSAHVAVYDPPTRRMVVFGGTTGRIPLGLPMALHPEEPAHWTPLARGADARRGGTLRASAVLDPARRRMLVFGGEAVEPIDRAPFTTCVSYDTLYEVPLDPHAAPRVVAAAGPGPGPRYAHAAMWDPVRDRMLVWGGWRRFQNPSACYAPGALDDLWELGGGDAPAWRPLSAGGEPPPAGMHAVAFHDAAADRMVLVGERGVWSLSLGSEPEWARVPTVGAGPGGFDDAAFDPARRRVLVLNRSMLWGLDLDLAGQTVWRRMFPFGVPPQATAGTRLAWDPVDDQLLVHGGIEADAGSYLPAVWAMRYFGDDGAWGLIEYAPPTQLRRAVIDPARDRLVAPMFEYGGVLSLSLADPRGWSFAPWQGDVPSIRHAEQTLWDPRRERFVVFGEDVRSAGWATDPITHVLSVAGTPTWSALPGPSPAAQRSHGVAIVDPRRDRIVSFGGLEPLFTASAAVWERPLADDGEWRRAEPLGAGPGPRWLLGGVLDAARDRLIVMGGIGPDPDGISRTRADVWALHLEPPMRWERLDIEGDAEIQRRSRFPLAWDTARDRMILQGGLRDNDAEVLVADFTRTPPAWSVLDLHCCAREDFVPPRRVGPAVAYDARRDALVMTGGVRSLTRGPVLNEVWELVWGEPVRAVRVDVRPGEPSDVVNPGAQGVLPVAVLGEPDLDVATIDVATLRFADAPVRRAGRRPQAWTRDADGDGIADLVAHVESSALAIAPGDSVAPLEAKAAGNLTLRGRARIRTVPAAGVHKPQAARPLDAMEARTLGVAWARPGTGGSLRVAFTLASQAPARLEAIDVSGRRVAARDLAPGTGAGEVTLAGPFAPGVVLVRLAQDGRAVARKVAVVR
jgi:hypothetical protein